MLKYGKRWMHDWLGRLGVRISDIRDDWPVDRSHFEWEHPLEALHAANGRDVLLRVPLSTVRFQSLHGFIAQRGSRSPFVKTIADYLDGRHTTYAGSALETFYATCQPTTAAEFMQLPPGAHEWLRNQPAIAAITPWFDKTPEQQRGAVIYWEKQDSREHGDQLGIEDGFKHFGPVGAQKGELEFTRLIRVADSIARHGFRIDPKGEDNIWVAMLLDGDNYRFFQEGGGNHRIAALAALRHKEVVVQIRARYIIRRGEAKWWPMVRKGWLTELEALTVFDRIFRGN